MEPTLRDISGNLAMFTDGTQMELPNDINAALVPTQNYDFGESDWTRRWKISTIIRCKNPNMDWRYGWIATEGMTKEMFMGFVGRVFHRREAKLTELAAELLK